VHHAEQVARSGDRRGRLRWAGLAATKSIAEGFLQAAAQAPQPMHGGVERHICDVFGDGDGIGLGSTRCAPNEPPACRMRSSAAETARSRMTKGSGADHRIRSPSRSYAWGWQRRRPAGHAAGR
jgi:hypothetical protein